MNYALPAKLRVFGDGSASARSVPHRSRKDDTLAVFLADILIGKLFILDYLPSSHIFKMR